MACIFASATPILASLHPTLADAAARKLMELVNAVLPAQDRRRIHIENGNDPFISQLTGASTECATPRLGARACKRPVPMRARVAECLQS